MMAVFKFSWLSVYLIFGVFAVPLLTGEPAADGKSIISMPLDVYRIYLQDNRPLDRLFLLDNTAFFLVDRPVINQLKKKGTRFRFRQLDNRSKKYQKSGSTGQYHTYEETVSLLQELAGRFPELAQVFTIGKSIEGRDLWMIKISDRVQADESEPIIFISGCHHAREWISVEIPLLFIRHLLENYAGDQQVRKVVDGAQIFVIPIQNPDGFEYSIHTYRMWRKNRRYNQNLDWGVDTNRNYGFMWGIDDQGSSPYPFDAVYRGPYPFSEPETQAIKDFLLQNPPSGALNFHNFSQLILYPWGYTAVPTPDDVEMKEIARNMSEMIYRVNGRMYEYGPGATTIYPTNGDADDWIYATFGVPSYTIELPPELFIEGGFFTSSEMIQSVFNEQVPAMMYFVQYIIDRTENGGIK
jgi:carboxypeptidase T